MGPEGPAPLIGVQLVHAPEDAYGSPVAGIGEFALAGAVTDGAGRFDFAGVPAGRYRLRVLKVPRLSSAPSALAEASLWASLELQVGESDMDNLAITLSRGFRAAGIIAIDQRASKSIGLDTISVTLSLADGRPFPGHLPGKSDADGVFRTIEYPAGRYFIDVAGLPAGWMVKSLTTGGRDVQLDAVELRDRDINDLAIVVTDARSSVSGSVRTARGAADDEATIVLFPLDHARWVQQGGHERGTREVRSDRSGAFQMSAVPAGSYLVATIDDREVARWRAPASLAALARRAIGVTVEPGRDATVALTTGRR
jgi:hypothetical protein